MPRPITIYAGGCIVDTRGSAQQLGRGSFRPSSWPICRASRVVHAADPCYGQVNPAAFSSASPTRLLSFYQAAALAIPAPLLTCRSPSTQLSLQHSNSGLSTSTSPPLQLQPPCRPSSPSSRSRWRPSTSPSPKAPRYPRHSTARPTRRARPHPAKAHCRRIRLHLVPRPPRSRQTRRLRARRLTTPPRLPTWPRAAQAMARAPCLPPVLRASGPARFASFWASAPSRRQTASSPSVRARQQQ